MAMAGCPARKMTMTAEDHERRGPTGTPQPKTKTKKNHKAPGEVGRVNVSASLLRRLVRMQCCLGSERWHGPRSVVFYQFQC